MLAKWFQEKTKDYLNSHREHRYSKQLKTQKKYKRTTFTY